jgi:hypothetical protein
LFIPLLPEISDEHQAKALAQYYGIYLQKNKERQKIISQIEGDYQRRISEIDDEFARSMMSAEQSYMAKKLEKKEMQLKSLTGIGASILSIVLIATILVFLSIQRSVRKIEERVTLETVRETSPST